MRRRTRVELVVAVKVNTMRPRTGENGKRMPQMKVFWIELGDLGLRIFCLLVFNRQLSLRHETTIYQGTYGCFRFFENPTTSSTTALTLSICDVVNELSCGLLSA
jgi:hypothetical protein